jgi:hypothetical protein
MYAYSNNGLSLRAVADDYVVQAGEVLFSALATPDELTSAFSGYAAMAGAENAKAAGLAAMGKGISIVSSSTPALNGTYPLSSDALFELTGLMAYTEAKGAFPNGASTLDLYDASGKAHTCESVAGFQAFAEACCALVTQIKEYVYSGGSGSLPSLTVTIP